MGNSTQRNILNTVTINFAVKGTSATQKHAREMGDSYAKAWDDAKTALQKYQDTHARNSNPKRYDNDIKALKDAVKNAEKDFKAWKELFDKGAVDYQKFMDYIMTYENLGPAKLKSMLSAIRKSINGLGDLYDKNGEAIDENIEKLQALAQSERMFSAQADMRVKGVVDLTKALDRMNTSYAEASNYVKAYERNARDLAKTPEHMKEMSKAALQNRLTMHECVGEWKQLSAASSAQDFQQNIRTFKEVSAWAQKMGIDIRSNTEMMEQFQIMLSHFGNKKSWSLLSSDEIEQNLKDLQQISSLLKSNTSDKAKLDAAINTGRAFANEKELDRMEKSRKSSYGEMYEDLGALSDEFLRQEQERWKKQTEAVERGSKAWMRAKDAYAQLTEEIERRKVASATGVMAGDEAVYKQMKENAKHRAETLNKRVENLPIKEENGVATFKDAEKEKAYAEAVDSIAKAEEMAIERVKELTTKIEKKRKELNDAQTEEWTSGSTAKDAKAFQKKYEEAKAMRENPEAYAAKEISLLLQNQKKDEEQMRSDIKSLENSEEYKQIQQHLSEIRERIAKANEELQHQKDLAANSRKTEAIEEPKTSVSLKPDVENLLKTDFSIFNLTDDALTKLLHRIGEYKQAVKEAIDSNEWEGEETKIKDLTQAIATAEEELKKLQSKSATKDVNDKLIDKYAQHYQMEGSAYDRASFGRDVLGMQLEDARQRAKDDMDALVSKHGTSQKEQQLIDIKNAGDLERWNIYDDDFKLKKSKELIEERIKIYEGKIAEIVEDSIFSKDEAHMTKADREKEARLETEVKGYQDSIAMLKDALSGGKDSVQKTIKSLEQKIADIENDPIFSKDEDSMTNEDWAKADSLEQERREYKESIASLKSKRIDAREQIIAMGTKLVASNQSDAAEELKKYSYEPTGNEKDDFVAKLKVQHKRIHDEIYHLAHLSDEEIRKEGQGAADAIDDLRALIKEVQKDIKLAQQDTSDLTAHQETYSARIEECKQKVESLKAQRKELTKEEKEEIKNLSSIDNAYRSALSAKAQQEEKDKAVGVVSHNQSETMGLTEEEQARLVLLKKRQQENKVIEQQIKDETSAQKQYNTHLRETSRELEKITKAKEAEESNKDKLSGLQTKLADKESKLSSNALTAGKNAVSEMRKILNAELDAIDDMIKKAKRRGNEVAPLDIFLASKAGSEYKKEISGLSKEYNKLTSALEAYAEVGTATSLRDAQIYATKKRIEEEKENLRLLTEEDSTIDLLDKKADALRQQYMQTAREAEKAANNEKAQQYASNDHIGKIASEKTAMAIESVNAVPEKIASALGGKMGDKTLGDNIRRATEMFAEAFKSYRYQTDEVFKTEVDAQWAGFQKHIESYSKKNNLFSKIEKNIPNISTSLDDANAEGEVRANRKEAVARNSISTTLKNANTEVAKFKESLASLLRGDELNALDSRLKQDIDSLSQKQSTGSGSVLIDKSTSAIIAFDNAQKASADTSKEWHDYVTKAADGTNIFEDKIEQLRSAIKRYREAATEVKDKDGSIIKGTDIEEMEKARLEVAKLARAIESAKPQLGTRKDDQKYMAAIYPFTSAVSQAAKAAKSSFKKADDENQDLQDIRDNIIGQYEAIFSSLKFKTNNDFQSAVKKQIAADEKAINEAIAAFKESVSKNISGEEETAFRQDIVDAMSLARKNAENIISLNDIRSIEETVADVRRGKKADAVGDKETLSADQIEETATERSIALAKEYNKQKEIGLENADSEIKKTEQLLKTLTESEAAALKAAEATGVPSKIRDMEESLESTKKEVDRSVKLWEDIAQKGPHKVLAGDFFDDSKYNDYSPTVLVPDKYKDMEAGEYIKMLVNNHTAAVEKRKRIEQELSELERLAEESLKKPDTISTTVNPLIEEKKALVAHLHALNEEIDKNEETIAIIDKYEGRLSKQNHFANLSIEEIKDAMGVWQEEMRKCFNDNGELGKNEEKWKQLNDQYQLAGKYLQNVAAQNKMAQVNAAYDRTDISNLDIDSMKSLQQQMKQVSAASKQLGQNTSLMDGKISHITESIENLKNKNLADLMSRAFGSDGKLVGSEFVKLLPEEMRTLEDGIKRLATEAKVDGKEDLFAAYTAQLRELGKVASEVSSSQSLINIKTALADEGKSEGFYVKRTQELVALREQGNLTQKEVDELNAAIVSRGKAAMADSGSVKTIEDMRQRIEMLKLYRNALDITSDEGAKEREKATDAIRRMQEQYDGLIDKERKISELNAWRSQRNSVMQLVELAKQGELSTEKMAGLAKSLEDVRVKGLQIGADAGSLNGLKTAVEDISKAADKAGEKLLNMVKGNDGKIDRMKVLSLPEAELKSLQSYLDDKGKISFSEGLFFKDMSIFSEVAASIRDVRKATEEFEAGKTLERLATQANSDGGTMDYYTRVINDINKLRDSGTLAAESMNRLNEVLDDAKLSQAIARDNIKQSLTDGSIFKWESPDSSILESTNLSGKSIEDIEYLKKQLMDMRKSLTPSTEMTLIEQTDIAINELQKSLDTTQKKIKEIKEAMSTTRAWDILSDPLTNSEQDISKAKKLLEEEARKAFADGNFNGVAHIGNDLKTFDEITSHIQKAQNALDSFNKASKTTQMKEQFADLSKMTNDALKQQIAYWKEMSQAARMSSGDYLDYMQRLDAATKEMNDRLKALSENILLQLNGNNADSFMRAFSTTQIKEFLDVLQQTQATLSPIDKMYGKIAQAVEKLNQRQSELSVNMDVWKEKALKLGEKDYDLSKFSGTIKDLERYKKALKEYRKGLNPYSQKDKEELDKVNRALRNIAGTTQKLAKETNGYGTLSEATYEQIKNAAIKAGHSGVNTLIKQVKDGEISIEDLRNSVKRMKEELDTNSFGEVNGGFLGMAEAVRKADAALNEMEERASDHQGMLEKAVADIGSYVGTFLSFQKAADSIRQAYQENMQFSDALTDVQRTTNMTEEDIYKLSDALQSIDTRASNEEMFELATTAGQLGIKGVDNIAGFVEAADMLTVTLSELGREGVTDLTKISNLMGDTEAYGYEKALKKIGSSIKDLSSNTAASAGPIADFIGRIGSTGQQAGLTSSQIAALGATLDANAQSVEKGATGLTKFLIGLQGKSHNIAEVLHISPDTLDGLLQSGQTMEAIYLILDKIKESGGASAEVLKIFGSRGAQMAPIFNTLAEHLGELKDNVDLSNKSFKEGVSIQNQFELKNNNAAGYMARTSNLIKKQFVNSGWTQFWTKTNEGIYKFTKGLIVLNKWMGPVAPLVRGFILYLVLAGARVDQLTVKMWRQIVASRSWARAIVSIKSAFTSGSWINLAIAGITMAIDAITTYIKKANEAANAGAKQAAAMKNEINVATSAASSLFETLKRYKKGTDEYKQILRQINSSYGRFLNNRLSELSTATELAIAQERINAGLSEEIILRDEQSAKQRISEQYDETVTDAYFKVSKANKNFSQFSYATYNHNGYRSTGLMDYRGKEDLLMATLQEVIQEGADKGWKFVPNKYTAINIHNGKQPIDPFYQAAFKKLSPLLNGDKYAVLDYLNRLSMRGNLEDYYNAYSQRQKGFMDVDKMITNEKLGAQKRRHAVDMKEMSEIRKEYMKGLATMQQNPSALSENDYKRLHNLDAQYNNMAEKYFNESSTEERKNFDKFRSIMDSYRKQILEGAGLSTEYWVGQRDPLKMNNKELVAFNKKLFNEYSNYQQSGDWAYYGSLFNQTFTGSDEEIEQQARDWTNEMRLKIEKELERRHINRKGTWWANESEGNETRKTKKEAKEMIDILLKELEEYYNRQKTAIESEGLSMGRAQELIDRDVNAKHQEYLNMRIGLINSMVGKETKLNSKQQEVYKMFTNKAIEDNKKRYAELKGIVESGARELTNAERKEYVALGDHINSETGWDSIFDPESFMADMNKIRTFFSGSDAASIRKEYSDFVKSLGEGDRDLTAEELQRYNKVRQSLGMGSNADKATIAEVKAMAKDAEVQAANKDVETRNVLADTLLKGSQAMLEYQKAWAKQIEDLRKVALEGAPLEKATDEFRSSITKLGLLFGDSDEEKRYSLDTDEFKRRMSTLKEMSADILVMTETDFEKRIEKASFYHSLWEKQSGELEEQFTQRRKMGVKALYQEVMKYRDNLDNAVRKKSQNQAKLLDARVQNGTWYEEMFRKYDTYLKQLKEQGKTEGEEYASIARVRKYMFDRMNKDGKSYYSRQGEALKKLQHEQKIEGIIKDLGVSNGVYESVAELKIARQQLLMERENLNARVSMYGGIVTELEETKAKLSKPRTAGESDEDYATRLEKLKLTEYNLNIARISNEELVKEAKEKTLEAESTLAEKEKALMTQRVENINQWREVFDELSKSLATAGSSVAESKNWEIAELRAKKALGITRDSVKQRMLILKQNGDFEEKWLTQEEQMEEEKRIAKMNERAEALQKFFQQFGEKLSKVTEDAITHAIQKNLAEQRAKEIADVEAEANQAGLDLQLQQQKDFNEKLKEILNGRVKMFQSAEELMQSAMGADGTLDVSLNADELNRNTDAIESLNQSLRQFVDKYRLGGNDWAADKGSPAGTTRDKQRYLSNRFQSELGLTPTQAAGLIGNLMQESNLNPNAKNPNSSAYGIAQWTKPRQKTFRETMGKDIQGSSLEEQATFIIKELQSPAFAKALSALKNSSELKDATMATYYHYEIPYAIKNGKNVQVDHTESPRFTRARNAYRNTSDVSADFSSVGNVAYQPIQAASQPIATEGSGGPVDMTEQGSVDMTTNNAPVPTPKTSFADDAKTELQAFTEYNNKLTSIQEKGDTRRAKSSQACAQAMIQAANMYGTVYQSVTNKNLSGHEKAQQAMLGVVGQVSNAMLGVLLQEATAQNVADQGSSIGKAFAKLGPIGGAAAVAGITAMFGLLLGLASNAISKGQSKISAITGSTSAGKLSTGMLTYATGRYGNDQGYQVGETYSVHGNDGKDYDAVYEGRGMKTGIRSKEHFGIFSEVKPEMVIDGNTTQKLVSRYPHLYNSILDVANGKDPRLTLDYGYITSMLDKINFNQIVGQRNMAKGMPTFAAGNYPYQPADNVATGSAARNAAEAAQTGMNTEIVQQLVQVLSDLRDKGVPATLSMKDFDENQQRYNRWKKVNGLN